MRGFMITAAAAVLLAGCSEDAPQQEQEPQEQRAELAPGQYEASWTVTQLRSTDDSDPATALSEDETGTSTGCIGEDGQIDPALFAESGDECRPSSSFVRPGRISLQMECSRPGQSGQVMQSVNATSTADSFEGEVSTSTYLSGAGDYQMTRTVTGRRVGECTAAAGSEAAAE